MHSKLLLIIQKYSFLKKSLEIFISRKKYCVPSLYTHQDFLKFKISIFVRGILLEKPSCSSSHMDDDCSSFTCLSKFHLMYCLSPSLQCQLPDSKGSLHLCASRLVLMGVPGIWGICLGHGQLSIHWIAAFWRDFPKITSKYKYKSDYILYFASYYIIFNFHCHYFLSHIFNWIDSFHHNERIFFFFFKTYFNKLLICSFPTTMPSSGATSICLLIFGQKKKNFSLCS